MSTEYFSSIAPLLPTELAIQLEQLCQSSSTEPLIDALIRFVCGAGCPETLSDNIRSQWSEKQQEAKRALGALFPSALDLKRPREGDDQHVDRVAGSKRQRLTPPTSDVTLDEQKIVEDVGLPIFTLCAISATSPVRKKVDVTIHNSALRFTNSGTSSIEATIPLSALHRAFLLPTRGKTKAHWTVVLISSDTPDRGKPTTSSAPQVIFGIDATTSSPLTTIRYNDSSEPTREIVSKGSATLPSLRTFLSHIGVQTLEPTADVFKSACSGYGTNAGQGGIPGVEAYRAAKVGSLWFMKEGILWGESKPCEFWAVEDLLSKSEGFRLLPNAGGRTCSVILTRKSSDEISADDEDNGVETEFAMIDFREQDGINQWVRAHRHLFGRKEAGTESKADKSPAKAYRGPVTIHHIVNESDSEDEDFHMKSSDEDEGSASSGDSDNEESDGDESEVEAGDSDAEGEDEEELKEENHPLLRRGAVPRMSKAALNMVVGMVEEDFLGHRESRGEGDDEEDELDE